MIPSPLYLSSSFCLIAPSPFFSPFQLSHHPLPFLLSWFISLPPPLSSPFHSPFHSGFPFLPFSSPLSFLPPPPFPSPSLLPFLHCLPPFSPSPLFFIPSTLSPIITLPPHTTDVLQPLHVCCHKPLNTRWDATITKWQAANYAHRITKGEVVDLLGKVWDECFSLPI